MTAVEQDIAALRARLELVEKQSEDEKKLGKRTRVMLHFALIDNLHNGMDHFQFKAIVLELLKEMMEISEEDVKSIDERISSAQDTAETNSTLIDSLKKDLGEKFEKNLVIHWKQPFNTTGTEE